MADLTTTLNERLQSWEKIAERGVVPGEVDTYELEQIIGRIKELKVVIRLLDYQDMI